MEIDAPSGPAAARENMSARDWLKLLKVYTEPSLPRSLFELGLTAALFVACWVLMWLSLDISYWLCALLAIPAGGFLVRLFLIQHDCGHGSFFHTRFLNNLVGRALGIITLTPYELWRHKHALHHAGSGNLDTRGVGDIDTLTVREYQGLSFLGRLRYWLYRHPVVMFGIGPAYIFLLQHRLPVSVMNRGWKPWVSALATNVGIALVAVAMMWLVGVEPFLVVQLPVTVLAATIGIWLFYVQHQFEGTQWSEEDEWNRHEAALHGSSFYDLPPVLHWFTANIGIHHIHHLNSRIPFYRLGKVLRDYPELKGQSRLTISESLRCIPLALWCEDDGKMISFAEARRRASSVAVV